MADAHSSSELGSDYDSRFDYVGHLSESGDEGIDDSIEEIVRREVRVLNKGERRPGVVRNPRPSIDVTDVVYFPEEPEDYDPVIPTFSPFRESGFHLPCPYPTTAVGVFKLFFTTELVSLICAFTNVSASFHFTSQSSHVAGGDFREVDISEFYSFLGLLIYMGIVQAPTIQDYWTRTPPFRGLWAPKFMSLNRFQDLLTFLHVDDPHTEDSDARRDDPLKEVLVIVEYMKRRCQDLFQPYRDISLDERMAKAKGRYYDMKNKSIGCGMKLYVVCDSKSGYTFNFKVYTGKDDDHQPGPHGKTYDTVMHILHPLLNQGYHVYMDNYYTSFQLFQDLYLSGTIAVGTVRVDRAKPVFEAMDPPSLPWSKQVTRGSFRYHRNGPVVGIQWMDGGLTALLSTLHLGSDFVYCTRSARIDGHSVKLLVPQPEAINIYNELMVGEDKSDQMMNYYEVLHHSCRYWKKLFLHIVDIACLNSCILFKDLQARHPEDDRLKRPGDFGHKEFRIELLCQLGGIEPTSQEEPSYQDEQQTNPRHLTCHIPIKVGHRARCAVCQALAPSQGAINIKSFLKCQLCDVFLCLNFERNCFRVYHSAEFDPYV